MITLSKQKKQVLVLYASSILGMLLGVVNSVLNTRSLDPVPYGDVKYVQNILSFVSSLLLIGYFVSGSRLLALSKNEDYSRRIRGAMCFLLAITVGVLGLVMLVLYFFTMVAGNENESLRYLYLISVPLGGNVLLLNYVNNTAQGDNQIGRISLARLLPSFVYLIVAGLIYHFFGATPVLMLSLYNGLAVLILGIIIISTKPSFKGLKESLRLLNEENKKYGFDVYLGSLAGVSTTYIAGITLGKFCLDNSSVGFYTLALTMAMPLTMLPSIIGTTYFKTFANTNEISKKVLIYSVGITLLSLLCFVLFVDWIVSILYNESYQSVSSYASYLAIATSVHGIGDMFNRFLGAHGKGKELRNSAVLSGIVVVIGSFILVYYFQITGAIITKILGSVVYFSMMLFYYIKFVKNIRKTDV